MILNVFFLYKLWAILLAIQAFLDVGGDGLDSDGLSVVLDKVEVGETIQRWSLIRLFLNKTVSLFLNKRKVLLSNKRR